MMTLDDSCIDYINTYFDMWMQSSDQETAPILCESCNNMIDEEDYINHWLPCRNEQSKPKSNPPAVQKKEQKNPENTTSSNEQTCLCPTCGQIIALTNIEQHMASCQRLMVECSYCQDKFPVEQLQQHESNCQSNSNSNRIQLNEEGMQQLISLMGNMNQNGGGNGNRNGNGNGLMNPNLLEALLRARVAAGNGNGNGSRNGGGGSMNPTQQLLHQSLFPALRKMDQGIKKRDLNKFPTEKYIKEVHAESKCSICMQDFGQGQEVMKIKCNHIHHAECYKNWLQRNNTCPLCKAVITPEPKPKSGQ